METLVKIKNLTFGYDQKLIFTNLSASILAGKFYTVLGGMGSGKSTLAHLLCGMEQSKSVKVMNSSFTNPQDILLLTSNEPTDMMETTVQKELHFLQKKTHISSEQLGELLKQLELSYLLPKNPHLLSNSEKQMVMFLCAFLKRPKLLLLDDSLCFVESSKRKVLVELIKQLTEEGSSVIYFTSDTKWALSCDSLVLLKDGIIAYEGEPQELGKQERVFVEAHLEFPFAADLANKLRYYEAIPNLELDMGKVVDLLWK